MNKRKSGITIAPPPPVVLPLRAGAYISNFNTICGVPAEEDSLLDWAVAQKLNTLSYYDMSAVLATEYNTFAAFWTKAKSRGIIFQGSERGSQNRLIGTPFNSTKNYNISKPNQALNFQFENEFWNYNFTPPTVPDQNKYASRALFPAVGVNLAYYQDLSDTTNSCYYQYTDASGYIELISLPDNNGNIIYRDWIIAQQNIYQFAKANGMSSDFYIGQLHDYILNTPDTTIALDMVKTTDRIYLSWYVSTAEFLSPDAGLNFVRTRLNLLGEAAHSIGKKIDILPIFAGTSTYMETYFATPGNTLLKAYNRALSVYNNNPGGIITNNAKLGINFKAGFQGYAISR